MQYYGSPEVERARAGDGDIELEPDFGSGKYPEFLSLARHIAALDPYFTNAGLYAAGSLAFNIHRPEEAVSFLNGALVYHPKEWKYVTMLAAIGYSKAKDPAKVAKIIAPLLMEPDCPVMIRQLAAFLNKKAGNYHDAYLIYKTILETTRDQFYINNARRELAKLEAMKAGAGETAGRSSPAGPIPGKGSRK
jgi:tetratricopeptide (TPR) repeat protein